MKWFHGLLAVFLMLSDTTAMSIEASPQSTWLQRWREATVALGTIEKAKVALPQGKVVERDIFAIVGTGVIFGLPEDKSKTPYLVTCKHVFYDPAKNWEPDVIQLRFAWFDEESVVSYLGIPVQLKGNKRRLWIPHPTDSVDLAAIPLSIAKSDAGREKVPFIPLGNFAGADDIYEGASIIVFGYPSAVGSAFWTRAVARSGIVAWVNPKTPAEQRLLIDVEVFPGNSGGPVFKIPTGLDRRGNFVVGGKVKFLGIVSKGRKESMPLEAEGKQIKIQDPKKELTTVVSKQWIGIGIVEPATRVVKLLKAATNTKVVDGSTGQ